MRTAAVLLCCAPERGGERGEERGRRGGREGEIGEGGEE